MTRWRAGVPERVADTCRSLKCASQSRYANARSFATACTGHPPGFLGMPLTSWRESRYRIITVCNGRAWHPAVDGVRYRIDGSTYRYWLWGRGIRRILLTSAAQPGRLGMVLCPFSDVCGTPSVTAFGRHAASVRERVIPARGHNGLSAPCESFVAPCGVVGVPKGLTHAGGAIRGRPDVSRNMSRPRAPSAARRFNIEERRTRKPGRTRAWRIRARESTDLAASNDG